MKACIHQASVDEMHVISMSIFTIIIWKFMEKKKKNVYCYAWFKKLEKKPVSIRELMIYKTHEKKTL